MNSSRTTLGIITVIIFVLGAGAIVYYGRPVMQLQETTGSAPTQQPVTPVSTSPTPAATSTTSAPAATSTASAPTPTPSTPSTGAKTYTLADVAQHATESDCWSVVNGKVYDLSSWVSRHPGGSRPIVGMCGKDATANFTRKHGGEARPEAMLALLKIGDLR